jgi:hypothetical protein
MKKIWFITYLLSITVVLSAQNCENFYYLQANKTVEMTIYGKNDKITGVQTYKVSDVKKNGNSIDATINSEMVNDKGKSLAKSVIKASCAGGILKMDMTMFVPSAQQQQLKNIDASSNAVYLEYPASMKAGDALPDGFFSMDMKQESGLVMTLAVEITNRKAEGKENINTSAGNWECFKITSNQKITTKISGIGFPIKLEVTEWFAPGFGVVKTESKYGKTEITSIK